MNGSPKLTLTSWSTAWEICSRCFKLVANIHKAFNLCVRAHACSSNGVGHLGLKLSDGGRGVKYLLRWTESIRMEVLLIWRKKTQLLFKLQFFFFLVWGWMNENLTFHTVHKRRGDYAFLRYGRVTFYCLLWELNTALHSYCSIVEAGFVSDYRMAYLLSASSMKEFHFAYSMRLLN